MRGILGCLLGFWPLGQNPAGAIIIIIIIIKDYHPTHGNCNSHKIIYQAEVTISSSKETYIGLFSLCDTEF